jgi:hypothetical protein
LRSELTKLARLLRSNTMTAKQIALTMKCSVPTAYARLRALEDEGVDVFTLKSRTGSTPGPRAAVYGIR